MKPKDHYDNHLGNFYSWMVGNFEEKQKEQENFFAEQSLAVKNYKIAFDLGAGHGLQSISLAHLGYDVRAVDFSKQLLDELNIRKEHLNIKTINDDILSFLKRTSEKAELIVCMGDTLTHLESIGALADLVTEISKHLEPDGHVILSFRDLTQALIDEQRFILVQSDDSKILTCFLEYFPDYVMVHDVLHERQNGKWTQKVSAYPKLRVNQDMISKMLQENNIEFVKSEVIHRMIYLTGKRIS
ncbi:class I SAM-dependent methyltransferase [Chryseolinea sp. H1M3-3]|uniref:class I SAM-dependent methyltransferase n=1 Tax=Chryseolinea sp. H1M3-3 TaxID=3034144 RepID=UPI0023EA9C1B|nr:class I SAM-dependent methyltransferase [Chryseolinea sp. H1M3-3]